MYHICLVLDRVIKAGLTVNTEKLVFATQDFYFFVYLVSPAGMRIYLERKSD